MTVSSKHGAACSRGTVHLFHMTDTNWVCQGCETRHPPGPLEGNGPVTCPACLKGTDDMTVSSKDLSEAQVSWLELLDRATSPFCKTQDHWDMGGVRAYTYGPRSVASLERKGLVKISADSSKITVTDEGRKVLVQLHGACGSCDGDGWECGKANCKDEKDEHRTRCRNARTCQSCDGRGY